MHYRLCGTVFIYYFVFDFEDNTFRDQGPIFKSSYLFYTVSIRYKLVTQLSVPN